MSTQDSALPNIDEMTLPQRVVHGIAASSAAMEKMAAEQKAHAEKQAEVAALIPDAVQALIANDRIRGDQEKIAAERLADPAEALRLLIKVAAHRNEAEGNARLGQGVSPTEKTAAAQNPYVGRKTSDVRASDRALYSGLGLAVPQS